MIDPNATISTTTKEDDVLGMISQALNGGLAVKKPKGTDGKDAGSWNLPLRGDKRDAKNMTEGGPITHKKLRVHALMRIVIWNIAAIAAGAIGTAIWFAKEGRIVKRMDERIGTGIIVQVVGVAVIVVGPT